MDRKEAIRRIRTALRERSGRSWSVTGGRGTSWGWIHIDSPPARHDDSSFMRPDDRAELAKLLGLDAVHQQGVSIPAGSDFWQEYIDRAEGREPSVIGQRYWD
jgi:hypothetical protein